MELVTIATYYLPQELALFKSKLESRGIECYVKDELTVQVLNLYSHAVGGVKLQVKKSDALLAMAVLSESDDFKHEHIQSRLRCPNCHSVNIDGHGLNGKICMSLLLMWDTLITFTQPKFECFDCHTVFRINTKAKEAI
jgi:Zn finger protein HypA/HybF involved in hydrogenase expression